MLEYDPNKTEQAQSDEGYAGISLGELSQKTDAGLATWQSGWKPGTDKHILAEKEWQRRIAARQLREQFRLEERLANRNRWWSIATAVIGVIGTLLGVWLGKQSEPIRQATAPQEPAAISAALAKLSRSSTSVTSAASTTISQPTKKTP